MEKLKHTPLPWTLCDDGGRYLCLTIDGEHHPVLKIYQGKWGDTYPALRHVGQGSLDQKWEPYIEMIEYGEIPHEIAIANAKFVIRAVNSHDALVDALKAIFHEINTIGYPPLSTLQQAKAALEIAKGE